MKTRMMSMALAGGMVFALSACDTTAPTFTVKPHAGFEVGSQLTTSDLTDTDWGEDGVDPHWNDYTDVERHLYWGAKDVAGCTVRYDILNTISGGEPWPKVENTTDTDLAVWHSDYNGDFGGGSQVIMGWDVVARDCAGNERTVKATEYFAGTNVWQETGENGQYWTQPAPHPVGWTGTWRTQAGSWASGGEQEYTTARGASVSFRHEFIEGQHIGLVMAKGPGRGSADVYVDNVKVGTVNTYAAANDNRRVVFDAKMTAGVHTLKVVNRATAGHPRIDVDAFLT